MTGVAKQWIKNKFIKMNEMKISVLALHFILNSTEKCQVKNKDFFFGIFIVVPQTRFGDKQNFNEYRLMQNLNDHQSIFKDVSKCLEIHI